MCSINDIKGTKTSDSYYNYYIYKIPKLENINWLVICSRAADLGRGYRLVLTSFYVYSEKEEANNNLYWIISLTVISAVNTLLLILILFKMFTYKNKTVIETLDTKLTSLE